MKDERIKFDADKTVAPRRNRYEHLSLIIVDRRADIIYTENDNRTFPLEQLPLVCLQQPDSIIAGYEVGLAIKEIAEQFKNDQTFQIKVSPIERELTPWKGGDETAEVRRVNHGVAFAFIGWHKSINAKSGWRRKHFPVDPLLFTASFKSEYKTQCKDLETVFQWAQTVRRFLEENDLAFRATQTGIAAQLLRDKRFYPVARRKIPRTTNERARSHLPGNFYLHEANRKLLYNALEVDQKSSHHSCAATLTFPDANALYAKGYFRHLFDKPFAHKGTTLFNRLISEYGLFYVKLKVHPSAARSSYLLPAAEYAGTDATARKCAFVYSNEVPDLLTTGVEIEYIIAAWTSDKVDTGLNRFARWALQELERCSPSERRWKKPLLLSAYGLLATRPRKVVVGYLQGKGTLTHYHIGRGKTMQFATHESRSEFEPGFVNVIHRGMIEAETRLRSLRMARLLESHGFRILTVYADAVYVAGGKQLPILSQDWGMREITNALFPNSNQIVCDQYAKLPGHAGRRRTNLINEITGKVTI